MTGTVRRRRRRVARVVVAVAVVLGVGAGTAAALGFGFDPGLRGGDRSSNTRGASLPATTAQVTRKTLVDTQTKTGELGYGDATTVNGRLPGTVTALPATGSVVERGQALYHVDNSPVVLLYGELPAYRALASGTEGADVKQFKENLYELGYRGFTVDEKFSDATVRAVKKWQYDLGLEQTGRVEHGRVVYAAGPVRVDSRRAAVGDPAGGPVLTYTGTSRVITLQLAVSEQRLARKDVAVSVTLPDGKPVPGKITNTQTVVKPASGQSSAETKIKVTVTIDDEKAVADLDQATLDIGFTASQRENVLTVPVAALLALAEGGYGVQVVEGTATRILAVRSGRFAGGRVEVSGDGLTEGMTVGMPS